MLDLLPVWLDDWLCRRLSPVSRWISRRCGGADAPICAQVGPRWAAIIGQRHCAGSRDEWPIQEESHD